MVRLVRIQNCCGRVTTTFFPFFPFWPAVPCAASPLYVGCVEGRKLVFLVHRTQINRSYTWGPGYITRPWTFSKCQNGDIGGELSVCCMWKGYELLWLGDRHWQVIPEMPMSPIRAGVHFPSSKSGLALWFASANRRWQRRHGIPWGFSP